MNHRRVIVVGMNPGGPFRRNSTMHRLNRWLDAWGLPFVSFTNCSHHPGEFNKRDVDLDQLRLAVDGYERGIALGWFVRDCLHRIDCHRFFTMPHPSPRNRTWNDPTREPELVSLCARYLDGETHGDQDHRGGRGRHDQHAHRP